jgi:hypothetical protein
MKRINKQTKAITRLNLETKSDSKCKTCKDNDVNYSIGFFEAMTMVK